MAQTTVLYFRVLHVPFSIDLNIKTHFGLSIQNGVDIQDGDFIKNCIRINDTLWFFDSFSKIELGLGPSQIFSYISSLFGDFSDPS
jgi:hypothetical protein